MQQVAKLQQLSCVANILRAKIAKLKLEISKEIINLLKKMPVVFYLLRSHKIKMLGL